MLKKLLSITLKLLRIFLLTISMKSNNRINKSLIIELCVKYLFNIDDYGHLSIIHLQLEAYHYEIKVQ